MPTTADGPLGEFKSPPSRLARLFLKGRDSWKEKCRGAKLEIKILKNRIHFLEESKAALKERNQRLKAETDRLKSALAAEKKRGRKRNPVEARDRASGRYYRGATGAIEPTN